MSTHIKGLHIRAMGRRRQLEYQAEAYVKRTGVELRTTPENSSFTSFKHCSKTEWGIFKFFKHVDRCRSQQSRALLQTPHLKRKKGKTWDSLKQIKERRSRPFLEL